MKLNNSVFEEVSQSGKKIIAVTKYWESELVHSLLPLLAVQKCFLGIGENRAEQLEERNFPREVVHFIGRIQSRKIPEIINFSSVVHSLDNLKHARIFSEKLGKNSLEVFIQVNVTNDPQKGGILPGSLPNFLDEIKDFKNLQVVGLSNMGWGEFAETEKRQEFRALIQLRDKYLPEGKTSAGTSRDYHLALEEGIDIVRVGRKCFL